MFERLSMARPASVVPASCYSVYAVRCLEENTLFEYVSDGLDSASRQAVVEHAASCESCRRMIAAAIDAAPSLHGAVTEPHGEARPGRSTPRGPGAARGVSLDSERLLAGKYRRLRLLGVERRPTRCTPTRCTRAARRGARRLRVAVRLGDRRVHARCGVDRGGDHPSARLAGRRVLDDRLARDAI